MTWNYRVGNHSEYNLSRAAVSHNGNHKILNIARKVNNGQKEQNL